VFSDHQQSSSLQSSLSQASSSLTSYFTLAGFAMRHVDGVSKMKGLLLMLMFASAFLKDFLSSSLESPSSDEPSLS
jgi:hypothetical protein